KYRADQQPENCATTVDHDIPDRWATRRDERLVKFVSGSHKQAHAQDAQIPNWYRPLEIPHQSRRAKQEQSQNSVLGNVRTLSKNEVNRRKGLRRNAGFEPEQKRDNESRCVL